MSRFLEMVGYDARNVLAAPLDRGEPTSHVPAAGAAGPTGYAVWSPTKKDDAEEPSVADRCEVFLPFDPFALTVSRKDTLLRHPGEFARLLLATGEGALLLAEGTNDHLLLELTAEETWSVESSLRGLGAWTAQAVLTHRPRPRAV